MKIYFNRPTKHQAWGGGSHFITNLHSFLKDKMDVVFEYTEDVDLIFMFDPRRDNKFLGIQDMIEIKNERNIPIIQRINDTDIARHAYGLSPHDPPWREKTFLYANQFVDHTVFVSNWVKSHYENLGYKCNGRGETVIINGCNEKYFYPNEKRKNNEKLKIITHHWSNNLMKGADVYIALDHLLSQRDDIEFTYLGRYPEANYVPKFTNLISPKYGQEVGDILRDHDVYVTGSRFEACGMHFIEAACCGLPVMYHKDGGSSPEVCRSFGKEFDSVETLVAAIDYYKQENNRNDAIQHINYDQLKQKRCNNEYLQVIMKLIKER